MRRVRFIKDFDFREVFARKNCVFCKVLGLRAYKASDKPLVVSEETAQAAIKAGAAIEVEA